MRLVGGAEAWGYATLRAPYLQSFQMHRRPTTDARPSTGPARHGAGGSFDACRYHCVMMSHGGGERGRVGGMIKGKREGRRSGGEDIQDNNGTKMATVCAAGRPPVSGPPGPGSPPVCSAPRSGKMATAKATPRNHRVKPSHLRRSPSTVRAPSACTSAVKPLNGRRLITVTPSQVFVKSCHSF